ncbi:MAG: DUF2784 domain-containing protein [Planctomycetes bacterium]|nr:DUF2784 domain-containing protein [Planctomycetota bacterium]HPF13387.1 DUF2784 domain-containing protein [Planctomycetota bacterium]HRV80925.1 DUF2784 domain-containing protein [Planctomycetota bacterium]
MFPALQNPALQADLIAAVHLSIVAFILVGQLLVLVGWPLKLRWIRNPWFRFTHLAIMVYIVQNAVRGKLCFLTLWEWNLRETAGQSGVEGSFIGKLLSGILFVDVPQATLNKVYVAFFGLVLLGFWVVPPRLRGNSPH